MGADGSLPAFKIPLDIAAPSLLNKPFANFMVYITLQISPNRSEIAFRVLSSK